MKLACARCRSRFEPDPPLPLDYDGEIVCDACLLQEIGEMRVAAHWMPPRKEISLRAQILCYILSALLGGGLGILILWWLKSK